MKMQELTQERLKKVLRYDSTTGNFVWLVSTSNRVPVGRTAGCINMIGYRVIMVDNTLYLAHRLAWLYQYGNFPEDQIDHINGARSDNRIENLRGTTAHGNSTNLKLRCDNLTGIHGVIWRKDREVFHSRITVKGRIVCLGNFIDFFEACCARKSAEREYGFHVNHGRR